MPIQVIDTIKQKNNGDFALVTDTDILGGLQTVPTSSDRDAIPASRRKAGMRVRTSTDSRTYELVDGILNSNWKEMDLTTATRATLSIPVDYTSTFIPPAGTVIASQDDVTRILALGGATAFKYLMDAWDCLAENVQHNVVFNLAAGVHRPRNPEAYTEGAWRLSHKTFQPFVTVTIQGVLGSGYTPIVTSNTVTGTSNTNNDPYVDFSGAPFTGLDLRGYYCVFNTGQVTVIHSHTNSRLNVMNNISPAPTSGFVGRPGTILRNSYDDITRVNNNYALNCQLYTRGTSSTSARQFIINDIQIDSFFPSWDLFVNDCFFVGARILFDHAWQLQSFSVTPTSTNRNFQTNMNSYSSLSAISVRGSRLFNSTNYSTKEALFLSFSNAILFVFNSYIGGARSGVLVGAGTNQVYVNKTVFDFLLFGCVQADTGNMFFNYDQSYTGRKTTFRNSAFGIKLLNGASSPGAGYGNLMVCEGLSGPCLYLGNASKWFNGSGDLGMQNGTIPNTDVGVQLVGHHNEFIFNASFNANGSVGDIKEDDGTLITFASVTSTPIEDNAKNFMRKV
jgi:hypothetical protein